MFSPVAVHVFMSARAAFLYKGTGGVSDGVVLFGNYDFFRLSSQGKVTD